MVCYCRKQVIIPIWGFCNAANWSCYPFSKTPLDNHKPISSTFVLPYHLFNLVRGGPLYFCLIECVGLVQMTHPTHPTAHHSPDPNPTLPITSPPYYTPFTWPPPYPTPSHPHSTPHHSPDPHPTLPHHIPTLLHAIHPTPTQPYHITSPHYSTPLCVHAREADDI